MAIQNFDDFFREIVLLLKENLFLTEKEVSMIINGSPQHIQRMANYNMKKLLLSSPNIKFNRVYYLKQKRNSVSDGSLSSFSPSLESPRLSKWMDFDSTNSFSFRQSPFSEAASSKDSVFAHASSVGEHYSTDSISQYEEEAMGEDCLDNSAFSFASPSIDSKSFKISSYSSVHSLSCSSNCLKGRSSTEYPPSLSNGKLTSPCFNIIDEVYYLTEKKNIVQYILQKIVKGYFLDEHLLLSQFDPLWETGNLDLLLRKQLPLGTM